MYRLIAFTVENYRSFRLPQTIRFDSSSDKSVTAVFGPNAGGKSNIVKALSVMLNHIINSADASWQAPYDPFLLNPSSENLPTTFAIEFAVDDRRYSYSFSYDLEGIVREQLLEESEKSSRMNVVFERNEGGLNPAARHKGFTNRLLERTRGETLLITKGREDNNAYSNIVFGLIEHITIVSPSSNAPTPIFVDMLKGNPSLREKTLELLRDCDFSIRDIRFTDMELSDDVFELLPVQLTPELKKAMREAGATAFTTVHVIRDEERTVVGEREFDFWTQESMGTQKFFEVAVPIIDAIEKGKTIFIDEFGSYIHPTLSSAIIRLFGAESNNGASLVLTTHGTTILRDLSRGEIVFVDKNYAEESVITPLSKLGARDGEAFEKRYLAGLYGAVPIIEP